MPTFSKTNLFKMRREVFVKLIALAAIGSSIIWLMLEGKNAVIAKLEKALADMDAQLFQKEMEIWNLKETSREALSNK